MIYARRLAAVAVAGALAYVAIDVALFLLRTNLSLLHNAESDYGNGPYAWLMDSNFLVRGAFSAAAAGAIWLVWRRPLARAGAVLIGVWALSSGFLAFFRDDLTGAPVSAHGVVHLTAAFVAFLACLVGTLLLTIDFRGSPLGRGQASVLAVFWAGALLGFLALGAAGFHPHSLGGLYERIFIGAEILWLIIASAGTFRLGGPRGDAV